MNNDCDDDKRQSKQKGIDAENINEFIAAITSGGKAQMMASHDALRRNERHIFYFMRNPLKNRFANIVLFNEGAVILEKTKNDKEGETYIHATKIKSKYGNYVLAQSPKPETVIDWYRMIWQLKIAVIVCLIPLDCKNECTKYFEKKSGKKLRLKRFTVRTFAIRNEDAVTSYELRLQNRFMKEEERVLHVINFPNWKEVCVPPDPRTLINVLRSTWAMEQSRAFSTDMQDAPTLIHGVSGTRRTGTYVIISMLCKQINKTKQISIIPACCTIRKYRYGVMRSKVCFSVMLEAVLNFSADQGLLDRQSQQFMNCIKVIRKVLAVGPNADPSDNSGDE